MFWFCEQNKEENHTPTAIMSIVERVFKITPEGQKKEITPEQKSESVMTVEVCGVVYEGAVE